MDSLLFYTLLFILLSPGLLLTLPPIGRGIFMSGKTSMMAIIVHAVVFYIVAYLLRSYGIVQLDGFADTVAPVASDGTISNTSTISNKYVICTNGVEQKFVKNIKEITKNYNIKIHECKLNNREDYIKYQRENPVKSSNQFNDNRKY